jgi:predicted P-loop ATPase
MLGTSGDATASGGKWPDGQYDETEKPRKGILNTIEAIERAGITCTWDDFRKKEYWSGHEDKSFDGEVSDAAITVTRRNLHRAFRLHPSAEETREAVTCVCRDNKSNPVLDYFSKLKWDGQPRLDKLLHKYLGANDTPLNNAFSVKMMCAIVRRAKQPGCKFDHQLVLQGAQGVRKSTFCEDLAVFPDLFTDAGDLAADIKQLMEVGLGKQIIEFPEHAGHSPAKRDKNKATLTRKVDRARMAYAHFATDAPRQWVPFSTINPGGYLNDPTGERRYWHVAAEKYDRDAFLVDKDQIYAEAVVREPLENLWLDKAELQAAHDAIVTTVKEPNALVDQLANLHGEVWTVNGGKEERASVADIGVALGLIGVDMVRIHGLGRRIAEAMMELKWEKAPGTLRCHKGQDPVTGYRRPLIEQDVTSGSEQSGADTSAAQASRSASQDAPAQASEAGATTAFVQRLAKASVVGQADLEQLKRFQASSKAGHSPA